MTKNNYKGKNSKSIPPMFMYKKINEEYAIITQILTNNLVSIKILDSIKISYTKGIQCEEMNFLKSTTEIGITYEKINGKKVVFRVNDVVLISLKKFFSNRFKFNIIYKYKKDYIKTLIEENIITSLCINNKNNLDNI